ncbi:MAG TPA: flagellar basal-body MS-ring/collar protein FliF [Cellvibrio sp.]|nr:flagellar basal-body MS-ring/collar protein FliF [Cellvibrio sp.]
MATPAATDTDNLPAEKNKVGGDFLEGLSSLNLLRQVGLMVTLAASVAIGFAVVMWIQGDDYRPLYGRMDNLDAANVVDVLEQNQIKFKVDENSGAILVASEDVHMARLKLAEFGLPSSPTQGFELMDKEQPLGTSQFVENTRYQRSIEGELARTITSITSIRSARVHLAIPKKTVFVRDVTNPTASVFLEVFAGRMVDPAQVKAIMNLVASSVPGMKMADVTVVDQHGNLLSTGEESADLLLATKQHQYSKEVESSVIKRINSILEPVVGGGKFRAEVSADIDFTAIEQAAETFNPDLPAVRSEQTLNETRRAGDVAAGIPGALTNQPPGTTTEVPEQVDPATGQPVAPAQPTNNREQATRNYELDRTVSYTKHQQGSLKRLTVAVVVDDKVVRNADGTETLVPWTENELERLSILVRDAVGFSAIRGDSVNVLNSPFANRAIDPNAGVVETPWWEQWVMPNIKYIASVLVILLIVFGLLRPMFKSLSKQGGKLAEEEEARQLAALEAAGGISGLENMSDETVTLTGGHALMLPGPEQGYEQQINAIKGLIADDPGRVAQVVKKWINRDD